MADKRCLVLLTSPRRDANSSALGRAVGEGAAAAGATVESIETASMKILPCMACDWCREHGNQGCVQPDAMRDIYPKALAADSIVFAGPIYWFTLPAQMKLVIDRLYAVAGDDCKVLKGKPVAAALAFGGDDPFDSGCVNAIRALQDTCSYTGALWKGVVYGSAYEAGALAANSALLDEARRLGRSLYE